jgi:rfaE bifunctional protein nucleotidyltransferase chain/domain
MDRKQLTILPLSQRISKSNFENIAINLKETHQTKHSEKIEKIAERIIEARRNHRPIILVYGAHLIKNGLSPLLIKMIDEGFVTHLATNGAGSIHDWEFAFQGKSEEDVRKYAKEGQFGIWDETGKYTNLSVLLGINENLGYGESVGKLISTEKLPIPELETIKRTIQIKIERNEDVTALSALLEKIKELQLRPGELQISHPYKQYSVQAKAFEKKIPLTIHPGFGYDIIYTHPASSGAAIGIASEKDFLKFVDSVSELNGGVFLSVGSSVMSPMIFEKSLSMARNLKKQKGEKIEDFMIVVNDIQEGDWQWGTKTEPPKTDPAYYLRFCKTFDRMEAREMYYLEEDNKIFLTNLYQTLKKKTRSPKIIEIADIPRIRTNKKLVTTNGTFDIMHIAHVKTLEEAKKLGDKLLVLVNSDSSVKLNKDPSRPIIPEEERIEMLAALECVDYVLLFEDKEVQSTLEKVKPDIHVKGGTFIPERVASEKALVESWGGKHICLVEIPGYSTTDIIKKIKSS